MLSLGSQHPDGATSLKAMSHPLTILQPEVVFIPKSWWGASGRAGIACFEQRLEEDCHGALSPPGPVEFLTDRRPDARGRSNTFARLYKSTCQRQWISSTSTSGSSKIQKSSFVAKSSLVAPGRDSSSIGIQSSMAISARPITKRSSRLGKPMPALGLSRAGTSADTLSSSTISCGPQWRKPSLKRHGSEQRRAQP